MSLDGLVEKVDELVMVENVSTKLEDTQVLVEKNTNAPDVDVTQGLVEKDTNATKVDNAKVLARKNNSHTKEDATQVLVEKDTNADNEMGEVSCGYCKKIGPTKRCSKRHPKCIKKLFCNETCEQMAHKKKEDPNAATKVDAKKAEVKKKKSKGKKENHGHVRATIAYKDYE